MNPSFREDDASQIPALLLLQAIGFTYLPPNEALRLRGGRTSNVLLEPVLRDRLRLLNPYTFKGETYAFSESNLTNAVYAINDYPLQQGYLEANRYIFDLLTLGKSFEETIGADKKSFSLQYIDWKHPERNIWHVTEELSVERSGSNKHYIPDIVLYVNGIPLVVIECKRPDLDKNPMSQAISQHLRNQQDDGIRPLYVLAQLLLSICETDARYGTNQTPEEFWQIWRERQPGGKPASTQPIQALKNESIQNGSYWQALQTNPERRGQRNTVGTTGDGQNWTVTAQDELLCAICRPERLLDLLYNFVLFDAGTKIMARYQQFFGVRKTLDRVHHQDATGRRPGGVIWHTQGSGKSYTMVMLAQLLASDPHILNPKIILVTDRVELDDQIYLTFKRCGREVVQAKTGRQLAEYLQDNSDAILATLVHKFNAAIKAVKEPISRENVFVLVDEAHRTQYGSLNVKMQQVFPRASFIAFTGTPLMRKEKNTAAKFGGIIDSYTVRDAVEDEAVVPLLFEGRAPLFNVNERPLDNYFNRIAEPLNEYQREDLKKQFSRRETLRTGEQIIYAKAWDISTHYANTWKDTGFKGQLVAPTKLAAVRFKRFMDEIGLVTTEVLISPPDDREGSEDAYGSINDEVLLFWKRMMDRFGTPKQYDETLRAQFKTSDTAPDIIIVVRKLLTGFDNPINIVLYLCDRLKEHTLFQAITRVNRKAKGKDYGFIIDYDGVIEELAKTLELYADHFEDFDTVDLEGTITDIRQEIARLPQAHSELWDVFKTITNRQDRPSFQNLLADEAIRDVFFDRLSTYSRLLKLALSNHEFVTQTTDSQQQHYRNDLLFFQNLRKSAINIYALAVDYSQYEPQIQKLIDTHVTADEVVQITDQVNIFDREQFEQAVANIEGTASRAHAIAARTERTVTERMDEDPTFYRRFSERIRDTLEEYRKERITEAEFLRCVTAIKNEVVNRPANSLPTPLQHRPTATAIYGLIKEKVLGQVKTDVLAEWAVQAESVMNSLLTDEDRPVVDWINRSEIMNRLRYSLDDLTWSLNDSANSPLSLTDIDVLIEQLVQVAKARY